MSDSIPGGWIDGGTVTGWAFEYEQPGADFTLIKQRATQEGMNPDEVVRDVVARYFEEEDRFVEAAKRGRHLPRRAGLALSC